MSVVEKEERCSWRKYGESYGLKFGSHGKTKQVRKAWYKLWLELRSGGGNPDRVISQLIEEPEVRIDRLPNSDFDYRRGGRGRGRGRARGGSGYSNPNRRGTRGGGHWSQWSTNRPNNSRPYTQNSHLGNNWDIQHNDDGIDARYNSDSNNRHRENRQRDFDFQRQYNETLLESENRNSSCLRPIPFETSYQNNNYNSTCNNESTESEELLSPPPAPIIISPNRSLLRNPSPPTQQQPAEERTTDALELMNATPSLEIDADKKETIPPPPPFPPSPQPPPPPLSPQAQSPISVDSDLDVFADVLSVGEEKVPLPPETVAPQQNVPLTFTGIFPDVLGVEELDELSPSVSDRSAELDAASFNMISDDDSVFNELASIIETTKSYLTPTPNKQLAINKIGKFAAGRRQRSKSVYELTSYNLDDDDDDDSNSSDKDGKRISLQDYRNRNQMDRTTPRPRSQSIHIGEEDYSTGPERITRSKSPFVPLMRGIPHGNDDEDDDFIYLVRKSKENLTDEVKKFFDDGTPTPSPPKTPIPDKKRKKRCRPRRNSTLGVAASSQSYDSETIISDPPPAQQHQNTIKPKALFARRYSVATSEYVPPDANESSAHEETDGVRATTSSKVVPDTATNGDLRKSSAEGKQVSVQKSTVNTERRFSADDTKRKADGATKRPAKKPSAEGVVEPGTTTASSKKHKSHSRSDKKVDGKKKTVDSTTKKLVDVVVKIKTKKTTSTDDVGRKVVAPAAGKSNKTIVDSTAKKTTVTSDGSNNSKAPVVGKKNGKTTAELNHNKKSSESGRLPIHKLLMTISAEDTTVVKASVKKSTPEENRIKPSGALKRKFYGGGSNGDASKKKRTAAAAAEEQIKIPVKLNVNNLPDDVNKNASSSSKKKTLEDVNKKSVTDVVNKSVAPCDDDDASPKKKTGEKRRHSDESSSKSSSKRNSRKHSRDKPRTTDSKGNSPKMDSDDSLSPWDYNLRQVSSAKKTPAVPAAQVVEATPELLDDLAPAQPVQSVETLLAPSLKDVDLYFPSVKTENVLELHGEDGTKSTINIPLAQNDIVDLTLDEYNDAAAAAVKSVVEEKRASPVPVVVPISRESPPSENPIALSITACPSMPTLDVHSPVKKSGEQLFPPVLEQCEDVAMAEEVAAKPPFVCIETERSPEKVQDKPPTSVQISHAQLNDRLLKIKDVQKKPLAAAGNVPQAVAAVPPSGSSVSFKDLPTPAIGANKTTSASFQNDDVLPVKQTQAAPSNAINLLSVVISVPTTTTTTDNHAFEIVDNRHPMHNVNRNDPKAVFALNVLGESATQHNRRVPPSKETRPPPPPYFKGAPRLTNGLQFATNSAAAAKPPTSRHIPVQALPSNSHLSSTLRNILESASAAATSVTTAPPLYPMGVQQNRYENGGNYVHMPAAAAGSYNPIGNMQMVTNNIAADAGRTGPVQPVVNNPKQKRSSRKQQQPPPPNAFYVQNAHPQTVAAGFVNNNNVPQNGNSFDVPPPPPNRLPLYQYNPNVVQMPHYAPSNTTAATQQPGVANLQTPSYHSVGGRQPGSSLPQHNRNVLDIPMQNRYRNMLMQQQQQQQQRRRSGVGVPPQNQQGATNYNGNRLMDEQRYRRAPVFHAAATGAERTTNGSNAVSVAPPPPQAQCSGQRVSTAGAQFHPRPSTNESICVAVLSEPFYNLATFYRCFAQFDQSLGAMTPTDTTVPNLNGFRRFVDEEIVVWSRRIVDKLEIYSLPNDFNVDFVVDKLIESVGPKVRLSDTIARYIFYKALLDAGDLRTVPILEHMRSHMTMKYNESLQSDMRRVKETQRFDVKGNGIPVENYAPPTKFTPLQYQKLSIQCEQYNSWLNGPSAVTAETVHRQHVVAVPPPPIVPADVPAPNKSTGLHPQLIYNNSLGGLQQSQLTTVIVENPSLGVAAPPQQQSTVVPAAAAAAVIDTSDRIEMLPVVSDIDDIFDDNRSTPKNDFDYEDDQIKFETSDSFEINDNVENNCTIFEGTSPDDVIDVDEFDESFYILRMMKMGSSVRAKLEPEDAQESPQMPPRMDSIDSGYTSPNAANVSNDLDFCICGNLSELLTCSGCLSISYCSVKCQKRDWDEHQYACKIVSNGNGEENSEQQQQQPPPQT